MALSKQLQTTLRHFHLDNPDATWEQLRDHLRDIAEGILATPSEWERMDSMGLVYSDVQEDLYRIAVTSALTHAQAQAITLGQQIMMAAQERVMGDPRQLVSLIDRMNGLGGPNSPIVTGSPLSVSPPEELTARPSAKRQPAITFEELAGLYMKDQEGNLRDITIRGLRSACKIIAATLGQLDLRRHSRADLLKLREALLNGRKPSTVNSLLTRLSTVLAWGVNNGYLEKTFDKKLKITKGAESGREAFSQEQVTKLMAYANGLAVDSWERWALSLGAITGARLNEIRQLRKADVRQVGGIWVVDINADDDKDLKTRHSARLVPLIDGAYGFNLADFLCFTDSRPESGLLFDVTRSYAGQALGGAIRAVLKVAAGGALAFHSFRHSMASVLKEHEISLGLAQAILGHSSQSITFDHYGGGQRVGVGKLADALGRALPIVQK
jgi:integrase